MKRYWPFWWYHYFLRGTLNTRFMDINNVMNVISATNGVKHNTRKKLTYDFPFLFKIRFWQKEDIQNKKTYRNWIIQSRLLSCKSRLILIWGGGGWVLDIKAWNALVGKINSFMRVINWIASLCLWHILRCG